MLKVITIDGPSSVGKGTVSRAVAKTLHWRWLDSGALYRLTAFAAEQKQIALEDIAQLVTVATHLDVHFSVDEEQVDPDIIWEGKVINAEIRTETCGNAASKIAAFPEVRQALMARQRAFSTPQGLVADGRDMGTIVFPNAPLKIFLLASVEVRAERRHKQLRLQGIDVNMAHLSQEIAARDERDRHRAVAPLVPAQDAVIIDTSALTVPEVCNKILVLAKQLELYYGAEDGRQKTEDRN